ncbi:MAG TPA: 3',5'-cyclic-AMP phosphodiesterase [Nitrococcus sp.]|nr:3',5'-cyclic-AMP phosphodiesterase [Nitrococcus sp.]
MAVIEATTAESRGGVKDDMGSLRVLQVTDTHLFADLAGRLAGIDTERSYAEVMEKVLGEFWPVDLILVTGDLVHDGSESGYRRFKSQFEDLAVRTLVIPGNHDDPALMHRIFSSGRVTWSDSALLGQWQFVMLDSSLAGSAAGHLAESQLQMLEQCLAAYPEYHALVCLHHHPIAIGCDWIDRIAVDNGSELFTVLDRHEQVRGVIWGHVHQEFESTRHGVRLLASPSTCVQFRPGQQDFTVDDVPPGFRWLQLYADGRIETSVVRVSAPPSDVDLECKGYR